MIKMTKKYEVLFRYLKNSNWNEDGSPSNDDSYYLIGNVVAENREQIQEWVDLNDIYSIYIMGKCKEIFNLFSTEDYISDSLEIVSILSEVGHEI